MDQATEAMRRKTRVPFVPTGGAARPDSGAVRPRVVEVLVIAQDR